VAAERGHEVHLHEREAQTGGQARLAQLLPKRAEFGGIITNLTAEAERHGATIHRRSEVTRALLERERPDAVILAAGSRPHMPPVEGEARQLVHAVDILAGRAAAGASVVVYDWMGDWTGCGIAEKLAGEGAHVRLAVNHHCAAASIQTYIRFETVARLHRLGVEVIPWLRLYGADDRTAFFIHTPSREAVTMEEVDTLVVNAPNRQEDTLVKVLEDMRVAHHLVGDALSPRTAEEAVYEGMQAGLVV
jgi:NADPH-dependent 2,4-dienoyl-CoA reductase/sulfur reductase-like enzyme